MATAVTVDANPVTVDLKVYAGDDFWLRVIVTDPVTADPIDLTGYLAHGQVRSTAASEEVLADFDTTITGNLIDIHLFPEDTAALPAACVWDLQITGLDNSCTTIAAGKIKTTAEVTR
jgi:hypothetical protein